MEIDRKNDECKNGVYLTTRTIYRVVNVTCSYNIFRW